MFFHDQDSTAPHNLNFSNLHNNFLDNINNSHSSQSRISSIMNSSKLCNNIIKYIIFLAYMKALGWSVARTTGLKYLLIYTCLTSSVFIWITSFHLLAVQIFCTWYSNDKRPYWVAWHIMSGHYYQSMHNNNSN